MTNLSIHPYMPNSVPGIAQSMLDALGVATIEDLYKDLIPDHLRYKGMMENIPAPFRSEWEVRKHVQDILNENVSTDEVISFLGAGCYRRYIPAVCDEIANRSEFLTAYCGDTYSDHGKMQAIFEYTSMLGELLNQDMVSYTSYDGGQAVCSSFRMALRIKPERSEILVPSNMNPEIYSQAVTYCDGWGKLVRVGTAGGVIDPADLESKLSEKTAAVFVENPTFWGAFEENAGQIMQLAHAKGAIGIVQPDLSSLGIVAPPADYGADITCGEIQPLGMHLQFGGGCGGFIAVPQDDVYIQELPTYLYGIIPTKVKGQYGYGRSLNYRSSHGSREKAKEYFGTEAGLWAIVAGVYMASMGPQGMRELGELIISNTAYAISRLSEIRGLKVNPYHNSNFQEFIVDFSAAGKTVAEINKELLKAGIFGGKDLSEWFPSLGQSALYCVSDLTTAADINRLCEALKNTTGGGNK